MPDSSPWTWADSIRAHPVVRWFSVIFLSVVWVAGSLLALMVFSFNPAAWLKWPYWLYGIITLLLWIVVPVIEVRRQRQFSRRARLHRR